MVSQAFSKRVLKIIGDDIMTTEEINYNLPKKWKGNLSSIGQKVKNVEGIERAGKVRVLKPFMLRGGSYLVETWRRKQL